MAKPIIFTIVIGPVVSPFPTPIVLPPEQSFAKMRLNPASADKTNLRCVNYWQICQLVKLVAELLKFPKKWAETVLEVNLAY